MPVGIGHQNLDPQSFPAIVREDILLPVASIANAFSSATSGGAAGSFGITALTAPGTAVFLSSFAAKPLFYGRRLQATFTDAAANDLRMTLRITGKRFGRTVIDTIVLTATATAVNGSRVFDEVTSVVISAITSPGAGDSVVVGFDDSWIGLKSPIKSRNDINMVYKISAGTPDATGPKVKTDLTAAMVNTQDSAIDLKTLYSAALAVTDRYLIEYFSFGNPAFVLRSGKRLG
jgi:hypothetical protein